MKNNYSWEEIDEEEIEKIGPAGKNGRDGKDGETLDFTWNGTELGIKRENQTEYQYVDLKGDKGDRGFQGVQGVPGIDGKSIEFNWQGTKLGVRLEGQVNYLYVDLKGEKGDRGYTGPAGKDGSDANVTKENVINAIGYTPAPEDIQTEIHKKANKTDIPIKLSQLTNDKDYVTQAELGKAGYGDMLKNIYDKNDDGIVDKANDSEKLGGKNASKYFQIHDSNLPYVDSFIVYGDSDKYYPVIIGGGNQDLLRTIKIWRRYSERAPSDWYSSTHKGSLMLHWMGNFGSWGGASYKEMIFEYSSQYTQLLADCFRTNHSMAYCFMLRGGGKIGAIYHIASDQPLRGHKDSSKPVDIFYNGEISYNNSNPRYVVYAPKPTTKINRDKLERIKIAKKLDNPILTDIGNDSNYKGAKYELVVKNGKPYLKVVSIGGL